MCDDHDVIEAEGSADAEGISRRRFVQSAGALAAAAALPGVDRFVDGLERLAPRAAARTATYDGTLAYSMAMHVHSSFSEQSGSMDAQLYQAATNTIDVLWWTDHDFRMTGRGYRKTVHFTSLTAEKGATGEGGAWHWELRTAGPNASTSTGGIVSTPSSPNDTVQGGALKVTAKSTSTAAATYGYFGNCHTGGDNYKDNLTGQTLTFDVMIPSGWTKGYLEILLATSLHTASGGRPAGIYQLSYRFVPPGTPASRSANGINGTIVTPLTPGQWTTFAIRPDDDVTALWPDLDVRDFQLSGITLSAVSTGDTVTGYVDYLRFDRQMSGAAQLSMQAQMEALLAPRYPTVTQRQGLEVSWLLPHLNWFGGGVAIPDGLATVTSKSYTSWLQMSAVPQIHAAGGLASYNHPYGYSQGKLLPDAQQDAMLAQVAPVLLSTKAVGCDLIEVGYNSRQSIGLARHVGLWDVMSRNGIFLTGNGTNDDHFAKNWATLTNNFFSSAWAASMAEADLLKAMKAGRVWCAPLSKYRGAMDLLVDGVVPMGGVSVSQVSSRQMAITATSLPTGSSVQVVRGPVDYAGSANPKPGTSVVATIPAASFVGGQATRAVDTSTSCFVRTQVVNSAGTIIGVSNPVWLLRSAPPGGVPAARAH